MASNGNVTAAEKIAEVEVEQIGKEAEAEVGVEKMAAKDIHAVGENEDTPVSVGAMMFEGGDDEKPDTDVEIVGEVPAKIPGEKEDGGAVDAEGKPATDAPAEEKETVEKKEAEAEIKESEEENKNPLKRKSSEGTDEVPAAKIAALEEEEKAANGAVEVEATSA